MWNNGLWREGTAGNDTIDLGWQAPWDIRDNAEGGDGDDVIWGNAADNQLLGDGGHDYISGSWGNDFIDGGKGNDDLFGDEGNDTLIGGADNDLMDGGSGNDELDDVFDLFVCGIFTGGASGDDTMHGGDGNDFLDSTSGADKLFGDAGNDVIGIENFGHNHLADAGLEIHGGSGVDTLNIQADSGMFFFGLGAHTDGIEKVQLDENRNMTMNLSFRDVINDSDNHTLVILGNGHDTVNLTNYGANDPLSGGHWVQGVTQLTSDPTHTNTVYNYEIGTTVEASVVADSSLHVNMPLPLIINPNIHL